MPHITEALWLAQCLRRESIPANEVRVGDILVGQGRVVLVTKIDRHEWGPQCNLCFETEPTRDGYEKCIVLPEGGIAEIIPRESLKPGLSKEQNELTQLQEKLKPR
jgi:hypothetical protein